jgi:hypothetical protein
MLQGATAAHRAAHAPMRLHTLLNHARRFISTQFQVAMRHLALQLMALALLHHADAHGFLMEPISRQFRAYLYRNEDYAHGAGAQTSDHLHRMRRLHWHHRAR